MKVLLTGTTGFIGTHVAKQLADNGHDVTGLVRSPKKLSAELGSKIKVLEGDLSIFCDRTLKLDPFDVVIHLAGVVAGKNEQEYADINYQATVDIVECINRQSWKPKRFLFASSLAAMGPNGTTISTEESQEKPIDPYGEAKLNSEKFLSHCDFPTTSFRPAIVIGPGDPATLTLFKIAKTGIGALPAGHVQPLSYIYVSDLVDAIEAMTLEPGENGHQTYFVSANDHTDSHAMLHQIGEQMGKKVKIIGIPYFLLKVASFFTTLAAKILPITNQLDSKQLKQISASGFLCSSDKLQKNLNWAPTVSFSESAKRALHWYKENHWL